MKRHFSLLLLLIASVFFSKAQPSLLWAKNFGGGNEMGYSIAVDASGNIYTTGFFNGTADFDPGPGVFTLTSNGGQDIFISKLDPSGNFIWAKSIGSTANDIGAAVSVSTLGGIYVTGFFNGPADFDPGAGTYSITYVAGSDFFILKLDASGNFVWAHGFGDASTDLANSVVIDGSDNILVGGYFTANVDFDPGVGMSSVTSVSNTIDAFILKLNSSGNFVWVKTFGGDDIDRISNITLDAAGNIYTTGDFFATCDFDPGAGVYTRSVSGSNCNAFVTKFDASGNFVWAISFSGGGFDYSNSVVVDPLGNVYTTGVFGSTTDFDPSAGTFSLASGSGNCAFISKLDASGGFVWAKSMNNYGAGTVVRIDASNDIFVGGSYTGTVDLNPNPGTQTATSAGLSDFFILKLDAPGNFLWAGSVSGTANDFIRGMAIDANGYIYSTGQFAGTSDFDPNGGVFNLTYTVGGGVFVQKLSPTPSSLESTLNDNNKISIYPNPATDKIFVEGNNLNKISITNSLGRVVFEIENNNPKQEIDLSFLSPGVYFLKISNEASQKVFKMLKE